jgi:hypothetical protein
MAIENAPQLKFPSLDMKRKPDLFAKRRSSDNCEMIVRSDKPDELDCDVVVVHWTWSRRYISLTLPKKLASRHPFLPSASPILSNVECLNEKYVGVSIIDAF